MSYETRYAAKKRQQASDRSDSQEAIKWRRDDGLARLRAKADRDLKFPLIKDADTAFAALAYFEAQVIVHMNLIVAQEPTR